jgi:hypothetical protein
VDRSSAAGGFAGTGSLTERLQFNDQGYIDREPVADERTGVAKKQEMLELVERIVMSAVPYVIPNPDRAAEFLATAVTREEDGRMHVRGEGFLDPSDLVELVVDAAAMRTVSLSAVVPLDEDTLKIRATYEVLPDGTNAVVRLTADHRTSDVRLTIENFDYAKVR